MANLHRSSKVPDWEKVPAQTWNRWQEVAAQTDGNVTPGNITSAIGGVLVLSGINDLRRDRNNRGVAKVFVGRVLDIADGFLADKTGTKSPKGEAVDATIDKIEIAAAIAMLPSTDHVPLRTVVTTGAQNLANVALTRIARNRDIELHPSGLGKKATTAQWTTMGLYTMSGMAADNEMPGLARVLEVGAQATEVTAVALGAAATIGYAREIFGNSEPQQTMAEFVAERYGRQE